MEKGIPFINDNINLPKEKKSRIVAWQRMSQITSRFIIDLKKPPSHTQPPYICHKIFQLIPRIFL